MINKNNFIRWTSNFSGSTVDNIMDESILNRAYIEEGIRCFGPLFFPGEKYSFYGNFDNPISDTSFSDMRLGVRRYGYLSPVTIAGTIAKDIITPSPPTEYYNLIFTITSFPDLSPGWYQFVIYDVTNPNVFTNIKALSNPIEVEELSMVKNVAKIYYRHSYNKNLINYEDYPDFYNIFHLSLIQTGFIIEQDKTQYRNVTNRRLRNLKIYTDFVPKIESYNFDEEAHKAMAIVYEHDTIFINKTFIVPKDTYQVDTKPNSSLSKASINVYVDYNVVNPNL